MEWSCYLFNVKCWFDNAELQRLKNVYLLFCFILVMWPSPTSQVFMPMMNSCMICACLSFVRVLQNPFSFMHFLQNDAYTVLVMIAKLLWYVQSILLQRNKYCIKKHYFHLFWIRIWAYHSDKPFTVVMNCVSLNYFHPQPPTQYLLPSLIGR